MARQQTSQTSSFLKGQQPRPLKGNGLDHPRRRVGGRGEVAASDGDGQAMLDERQRREMIATAAFLRAQRRGFESGAELEDWLAAEEEIDRWLKLVDRGSEEPPLFEE